MPMKLAAVAAAMRDKPLLKRAAAIETLRRAPGAP